MFDLKGLLIRMHHKVSTYKVLEESQYHTKLMQSWFIKDCYLLSSEDEKLETTAILKHFIESVFSKNLPVNFQVAEHPEEPFIYSVFCNTVKIFEADFYNKTYSLLLTDQCYDQRIADIKNRNQQITAEIETILGKSTMAIRDIDTFSDVTLALPILGKKRKSELNTIAEEKSNERNKNNMVAEEIMRERKEMHSLREALQEDIATCIAFYRQCNLTEKATTYERNDKND